MLTGRTVSPEAKRTLVERSRPRPRVPRATEGAVNDSTHFNRAPKMGTVVNGTYLQARSRKRAFAQVLHDRKHADQNHHADDDR